MLTAVKIVKNTFSFMLIDRFEGVRNGPSS